MMYQASTMPGAVAGGVGQAHLLAAGPYAKGGLSYQYVTGPDDQRYAVGGEVSIDTSPVHGDPEATIRKMLTVIAAANAPADPSMQDRAVAAQAALILTQTQAEMLQQAYAAPEDRNRSIRTHRRVAEGAEQLPGDGDSA
jgi:hypothetical protein